MNDQLRHVMITSGYDIVVVELVGATKRRKTETIYCANNAPNSCDLLGSVFRYRVVL